MFKLPVFDEKHPRFKKSMELDIQLHGYPDWKYKSNIVLDDTLPDGFVWSRSFQAEYDLNETINKTVDDLRCNLVIDLHKRKSYFERNRKFNKVLWNVPKFVIEDDQYTIAKNPYFINEYGVADSPEQILNHYKFLENEADNYFVCMTPVYKKHQVQELLRSSSKYFHSFHCKSDDLQRLFKIPKLILNLFFTCIYE